MGEFSNDSGEEFAGADIQLAGSINPNLDVSGTFPPEVVDEMRQRARAAVRDIRDMWREVDNQGTMQEAVENAD